MPGLFGIVESPDRRDAPQALSDVCGGLRRSPRLKVESQVDPQGRWGLGRVHLGTLQPDPQLDGGAAPEGTSRPIPRVRVLFHGDLANLETLAADLERRGHARPNTASAIVSLLYAEDPGAFVTRLKGAYVAAVLDEEAGRLLIVSDLLGSYPVYWFHVRGRFVFAPELHAALRAHPSPALDMRTVGELVEFGFPVAERTLAEGVSLLPPASVLTYDARRDAVTMTPYASIAALFRPSGIDRQAYLAEVRAAQDRAMEHAVAGSHRYGLSLSGGLDTRVILSAIDRLKVPLTTFTLGGRGCADQVIAEQLSALAHTTHHFVPIDEEYLDDLLPNVERMAALTDSMYLSHGFTETRARQAFEETDFSVLLRGHAGELAKASTAWPFHTDARIHAMRAAAELPPYLASRFANGAAAELFADRARDGVTTAQASLGDLLNGVDLGPADLTSYLYLRHYHRRVTIPSLEIFRDVADVRLPLADPDFLRAVLQGPPQWRDDTSLHQTLIKANGPKYLRVRNPNTGAPAGAGPLQEFVFDKMNTILRRLNVYGYRHYHSFDGWMRGAFLAVVKRVTLDPETLGRGVYAEAAVRRRITQAEQGDVAHDDLLQALVVVELWQRQNLA